MNESSKLLVKPIPRLSTRTVSWGGVAQYVEGITPECPNRLGLIISRKLISFQAPASGSDATLNPFVFDPPNVGAYLTRIGVRCISFFTFNFNKDYKGTRIEALPWLVRSKTNVLSLHSSPKS